MRPIDVRPIDLSILAGLQHLRDVAAGEDVIFIAARPDVDGPSLFPFFGPTFKAGCDHAVDHVVQAGGAACRTLT